MVKSSPFRSHWAAVALGWCRWARVFLLRRCDRPPPWSSAIAGFSSLQAIHIPKEENFHKAPTAVIAWDTHKSHSTLANYLLNFDDVCNETVISGLKMPDYIVMSNQTIMQFHQVNPKLRIILTLREPVVRIFSYFSMQLRLGWSPINHMGRNPCMQERLTALLARKKAAAAEATATFCHPPTRPRNPHSRPTRGGRTPDTFCTPSSRAAHMCSSPATRVSCP